ncbi:hypothetical protein, partial [Roseibacillus persicicus]|uniref:hypothetical protein n=1 Tax=Roseibacillus persicicus TaxID=454148 RepID=UPI001E4FB94E
NPTALASRRLDWRREGGRSIESALSRSDWVCWNVRLNIMDYTDFAADFRTECRHSNLLQDDFRRVLTELTRHSKDYPPKLLSEWEDGLREIYAEEKLAQRKEN